VGWLEVFFDISVYAYLLALIAYTVWFLWRGPKPWVSGTVLLALGAACQVAFIIAMGAVAGRPPFSNTFETMVLFSACVAGFYLALLWGVDWKPLAPGVAFAALLVSLLAYVPMQDELDPLVPALRDNLLLTIHVLFCFVSYAAFLLAYVGAITHLWKNERHHPGAVAALALSVTTLVAGVVLSTLAGTTLWKDSRGAALAVAALGAVVAAGALWPALFFGGRKLRIRDRLPEEETLQKTVYRMVALGFPFLTLGIITGSYWAKQAWGRYWGWDDKEVASLVTWLVFAAYLHVRLVPRWRGTWISWVAVAGFWCVVFTFLGVNYLLGGLHAYA